MRPVHTPPLPDGALLLRQLAVVLVHKPMVQAFWQLAQLLLSENFCQSKSLKNGAGLQGHRPIPCFHYPPDIVYFRYFFNLQATV